MEIKFNDKETMQDMQRFITSSYTRLKQEEKALECVMLDCINEWLHINDKQYRGSLRERILDDIKSIRAELEEYKKQIEFIDKMCEKYPSLKR